MNSNAEDFKKIAYVVVDKLSDYIADSQSGKGKVLKQERSKVLAQKLQLEQWTKTGGLTAESIGALLDTYLENSQHMHHPHYIGHQVATPHLAASFADFIHGAINNPMSIYEMGPAGATIERFVINWMLDKIGWFKGDRLTDFQTLNNQELQNGNGILTHGGSMANLTAMLAARANIAPNAWIEGTPNDLVILGSEVAHYSIARAISIMGMGKRAWAKVETTDLEVLKPEKLEGTYKQTINEGKRVMAVIANACATATGLYDPIDEIGHFCQENNLWFHVDGAHGASALLSDKERHWMQGAERADSMIWDTHKMLRTSTLCAAVLFKNQENLAKGLQQKGSYLFHKKEQLGFDTLPYTIECTKAGIGTKLFWVLAAEGEKGLTDFVENQYEITRKFYEIIQAHPNFVCPYIPQANILCFRYISLASESPTKAKANNDFQLALRNELVNRGNYYITSTELKGVRHLRLTVINPLTQIAHIEGLLNELSEIAELMTKK